MLRKEKKIRKSEELRVLKNFHGGVEVIDTSVDWHEALFAARRSLNHHPAYSRVICRQMSQITFVTGNKNKLKEVVAILSKGSASGTSMVGNYEIVSENVDLDEVQGTIEEVTIHKAKAAAKLLNRAVLVEDTALGFAAMNNLPGPYIKWFLKSLGLDGLNRMLFGFEDKTAYATCTFGLCISPESEPILFQGVTEGEIVAARGPTDFGWDPVFQPKGFDKTYAEMDKEVKNTISHRYKALAKLREYLLEI